jgi:predicted ABC-type ATPase
LTNTKQLWLLVGGNGAGKSTFYRLTLEPLGIPFVNADVIAKQLFPESPEAHSYKAAKIAADLRHDLLLKGRNFCFETVFSHPSKIDFVAQAKALGYQVIMVVIHLENPEINRARVAQRVAEGGHQVPDAKVESRIPRLLANIRMAMPLCDQVRILDNSSCEIPFCPVATRRNQSLEIHLESLPAWAKTLLS